MLLGLAAVCAALGLTELAARVIGLEVARPAPVGMAAHLPGVVDDPIVGPRPEPGWSGAWPLLEPPADPHAPRAFHVAFDARGLRADGGPAPDPDAPRVLFLGDSVTFGWGVDGAATFPARVAALARTDGGPPAAAMNLGFPGRSAVAGAVALRELGLPLAPDVVVVGFSANNAFRFTALPDAARFRGLALRRLARRSALARAAMDALASARSDPERADPRSRDRVDAIPLERLERVATPDAFAAALADIVSLAREAGARVVFALIPRAMQVSATSYGEDVVARIRHRADRWPQGAAPPRDVVEVSCLEPATADWSAAREAALAWRPTRPSDAAARRLLALAARHVVAGHAPRATAPLARALAIEPAAPLAQYDLGVVALEAGLTDEALELFAAADRTACSAFLRYQVRLREVAVAAGVPVVDLLVAFQARDAEGFYLDAAHFTEEGNAAAAEALWPAIRDALAAARPRAPLGSRP